MLLFLLCFSSYAQIGGENDFYLRGAVNAGTVLVQRYRTDVITYKYINGFELNYIKPSNGKKLWQYETNLPEHGFGFTCFNLNNPKVLGNIYAAYIFCDIPFTKKEKPFKLYVRLAPGIAYAPVHFNGTENTKNVMLSTPVNAYGNLGWYFRWNLGTRLRWDFGVAFTHVSNGNCNLPNLGVNILALNTGLVYKFIKPTKNVITKIDSGSQIKKKHEIILWAGIGRVQESVYGKKYQSQSYSVSYFYNIKNKHKIGMGVDVFYNPGNIELLNGEKIKLSSNLQNIQTGIKIGYAYNIGRLSIPVEVGYYVISKYKEESPCYQRFGVRYYFKNNIVALITLKMYLISAYNLEFGVGYKIGLKKTTHD